MTADDTSDIPHPADTTAPPDTPAGDRPRRRDDRRVPHNLEAEDAVLGALLIDAERCAPAVLELITARDFYRPANGMVADAVFDLLGDGLPVDAVTVAERLRASHLLDEVGGFEHLAELMNATPSVSGAASYAEAVATTATLRRLALAGAKIADAAFSAEHTAPALNAAAELLEDLHTNADARSASTLEVADFDALLAAGMTPPEPELLHRSDGTPLIYAGKMHALNSEPEAGKTWIALHLVKEVLDMGGGAVFMDYEDVAATIYTRLLALGADPDDLRHRFRYCAPSGPFGVAERAHMFRLLDDVNPDVVIIDGVAEALTRDGLSEDSSTEFVQWVEKVPRPIARTGAAVVWIDHIVKDKEQQGRYARGTGAKLAVIDGAAYSLKKVVAFSRHQAGSTRLTVAKDKPGGVGATGEHVGLFEVDPHADGARVMTKMSVPPNTAEGVAWKPSATMERVCRALSDAPMPLSAASVRALVPGKKAMVSDAIQRLIVEGNITEERQGRKTVLVLQREFIDPSLHRTDREEPPHLHAVPDMPTEPLSLEWADEAPPIWETHPEDF